MILEEEVVFSNECCRIACHRRWHYREMKGHHVRGRPDNSVRDGTGSSRGQLLFGAVGAT